MNEVTFHPVDTAWIGRLFRSRLEGPADSDAEKALFGLADQITNIKMAATALANELGPNDHAMFAAENRPFFIIDDDPNGVAAALEALMACDTIDEMMSIMAEKAGRVYETDKTEDPEDIVERNNLEMRLGALDVGSVDAFFSGLKKMYEEASPRKTLLGRHVPSLEQKQRLAFGVATAVGRVALKTAPAWYVQGAGLSLIHELPRLKDFQDLCGTVPNDLPWLVAKVPELEELSPQSFAGGCCAGVYIPVKNVEGMVRFLQDRKADIAEELAARQVPVRSIVTLLKACVEAGTYASRHRMAVLEENNLEETFVLE